MPKRARKEGFMKHTKRIFAMLLSLAMILSMSAVAVFAAPTDTTLKVSNPADGHSHCLSELRQGLTGFTLLFLHAGMDRSRVLPDAVSLCPAKVSPYRYQHQSHH